MSSNNSLQSFSQSNDNKNYSGGDLFDKSSFKEKSEGKGYTNYMLNEETQYYIINDLAFFILSDSKFIISAKYDKEKNVAIITYKEIICGNKKYKIEDIKDFNSEEKKAHLPIRATELGIAIESVLTSTNAHSPIEYTSGPIMMFWISRRKLYHGAVLFLRS